MIAYRTPSLLALGCALALAGCNTVEDRIAENRAYFDGLSPLEQENIRNGAIDLGYTPQMVYLALGEPDLVGYEKSTEGETEVWTYQASRFADYPVAPYYVGPYSRWYYSPYYGGFICRPYAAYGAATPVEVYDRLIVEFRDGEAVRIRFPDKSDYRPPAEGVPPDASSTGTSARAGPLSVRPAS